MSRLSKKSIPELASLFCVLRHEADQTRHKVARHNKAMDRSREVLFELRRRGKEAEQAVRDLLSDESPNVRIGASYFLLPIDPELACRTLKEVAESDPYGDFGFNAQMLLDEYRRGNLADHELMLMYEEQKERELKQGPNAE